MINKLALIFLVLLFSCSNGEERIEISEKPSKDEYEVVSELPVKDTARIDQKKSYYEQKAKEWLVSAINEYFSVELNSWDNLTTKTFSAYKSDLVNSNYTHGIDLDSIRRKWDYKYETSSNDIGRGFLIDAQDNGPIEIKYCRLIRSENSIEFVFKIALFDTLFKETYESELTVIPYNHSYAIDYARIVD